MIITLNGLPAEISPGQTVADVLTQNELAPDTVVVELNETIVDAADYAKTTLRAGDTLELLSFVGGG